MSEPCDLVCGALPEETAPLLSGLRAPSPPQALAGGGSLVVGRRSDRPVAVVTTGDGARRARTGLRAALETVPARRVVVIGIAGGLSPGLAVGDLVVAREVRDERGARFVLPDEAAERAAALIGAAVGLVVSALDLALTADRKSALLHELRTGDANPALVDLESSTYVGLAEGAGVPWTVVRAVSDTAEEELPAFLNDCRDSGGAVRRAAVLRHALANPGALPTLLRMRQRLSECAQALAGAVDRVLEPDSAPPRSDGSPGVPAMSVESRPPYLPGHEKTTDPDMHDR